jgi:WhiB family redox-sensing transcriptional regulator
MSARDSIYLFVNGASHHSPSLADLLPAEPWLPDAACAQTDPEMFYPEKGGSTRQAKSVCLVCEVRAECLDYALANDEQFGIWGGLSLRERRKHAEACGNQKPPSKASVASTRRSSAIWSRQSEFLARHKIAADQIRAWAAANGIPCGNRGPIPHTVLTAWAETDQGAA